MSKSAVVRARMEPDLKKNAEAILDRLGLNATQAITLFYWQVELRNGLPFEIAVPNETTKHTFDATDEGRDLVLCEDADDLSHKLSI